MGLRKLTPAMEQQAVDYYVSGRASPSIAAELGVTKNRILQVLHQHGVVVRGASEANRRHSLRHDAFDVLTHEAEYWCGFLFADGHVSSRSGRTPEVILGVSQRDAEQIKKLRGFLCSTRAITHTAARTSKAGRHTGPSVRLAVSSARLASRLKELGRYEGPLDAQLANSKDFWRGLVDGDGTLGMYCGRPQLRLVGSQRMLSAFVDYLARELKITMLRVRPHKSIFQVSAGWATAVDIVNLLYSDAPVALTRKGAKAAEITGYERSNPKVARTHCDAGHEYTETNTWVRKNGARQCRICTNRRQREYAARKKAITQAVELQRAP